MLSDTSKVVVIGASRGGLNALCELLNGLPANLPAPVMVVLHTSPTSPGILAEILDRCSMINVAYGNDGHAIEPGRVYLAPANFHMTVGPDASIRLGHGPAENHSRPAVDPLFRSAADVFGDRTIGVILTGGNHDGSDGLNAITAAGGTSIVQNPLEAEDPTMPINAIYRDHPNACLPIELIAQKIVELTDSHSPTSL